MAKNLLELASQNPTEFREYVTTLPEEQRTALQAVLRTATEKVDAVVDRDATPAISLRTAFGEF